MEGDQDKTKLELKNPVIHQKNENCQVFNGPISGCVFAMPGATVNQSSVQQVDAREDEHQEKPYMKATRLDSLTPSRQGIINELMNLIDKGEWMNGATVESMKQAIRNMLEDEQAETMWRLLEGGRGDRLRVTWQNMIGYFVEQRLLPTTNGAPALNNIFFGDTNGYSNIDKGRPRNQDNGMSNGFRDVLPLLDKYFLTLD